MDNIYTSSATSGITLNANKKILRIMGLWGPPGAYRIFSWTIALSIVVHLSTEIVAIYKYSYELKYIAIITSIMMSGIGAACKAIYCVIYNTKIQELVATIEGPLFAFDHITGAHQSRVLLKTTRIANGVTIVFEGMCVAIVVLWMAAPLVFGDPSSPLARPLPLLACFPFDTSTSPGYEIAYLFQVVTSFITTSVIGGVDTLLVSMLIQLAGQLEILAVTLEGLGAECIKIEHVTEEFKITASTQHKFKTQEIHDILANVEKSVGKDFQKLVMCIKHHQAIIEFAKEIQKVFGPIMLFQCCSSTLILCFVGFVAAESSVDVGTLIKCVVYLIVGTFELWLYCVFADNVLHRSLSIAEASYSSGWRVMPSRFKQTLSMVIMRAQRPITFRASFLYIMSLQTFASVLNASYSYFTILQQAKE